MIFFNAFLLLGIICLIAQIILDNTKLTPGHVTSLFVVLGAILGFFNLYEPLRTWAGAGASLPIISFGDLLFNAAYEGFKSAGTLGMFENILTTTSAGISSAIIFAFAFAIFAKPKD